MPKLDEYRGIKAAGYLGVCRNTLRNWEAAGKITVRRHPRNNHRFFKMADLEESLRQVEESGQHPTGWRGLARHQ